ncbi:MAG: hypothetical protein O3A46_07290 [Candidatus Poribacteria bacterium]|nr:hypothetical protein [Candidatus Poribacteria bacterium]
MNQSIMQIANLIAVVIATLAAVASAVATWLIWYAAKGWRQQFRTQQLYEAVRECLASLDRFADAHENVRQFYWSKLPGTPQERGHLAFTDKGGELSQQLRTSVRQLADHMQNEWDAFVQWSEVVKVGYSDFDLHVAALRPNYMRMGGAIHRMGDDGFSRKPEYTDTTSPDAIGSVKKEAKAARIALIGYIYELINGEIPPS